MHRALKSFEVKRTCYMLLNDTFLFPGFYHGGFNAPTMGSSEKGHLFPSSYFSFLFLKQIQYLQHISVDFFLKLNI